MTLTPPMIGDPAPWFSAVAEGSRVAFDEYAGRFVLLFFFSSASDPEVAMALAALDASADAFDGRKALLVAVGADGRDLAQGSLSRRAGRIFFFDARGAGAQQYGLQTAPDGRLRPTAFLLSPALQILHVIPLEDAARFVGEAVARLGEALAAATPEFNPPALLAPGVFDLQFCRRLIDLYDADGGREIGLIEHRGQTVAKADSAHRKRRDYYVADEDALRLCREQLERRLLPLVYRAFQFSTTRIERYLVGCYDAATGGFFRPHRDNTAPPVAHRRFAVTLTLNDEYEGGELRFPEFGDRRFKPPPGGAIVFSCSLLHEVTPVTAGRRYAFITFLYDEPGQKLREAYAKSAAAAGIRVQA